MKFDLVDREEAVNRIQDVKNHLDGDLYEDYVYKAYIESIDDEIQSALENAKGLLTVMQKDEDGGLEEVFLFPILPLQFEIQLQGTGSILIEFQNIAEHLDAEDLRARLATSAYARSPADAIRDLRETEVVLYLEEEDEDGGYNQLVHGTGTDIHTESGEFPEL